MQRIDFSMAAEAAAADTISSSPGMQRWRRVLVYVCPAIWNTTVAGVRGTLE